MVISCRRIDEFSQLLLVSVFELLCDPDNLLLGITCDLHPLVLHCFSEADLSDLSTDLALNISLESLSPNSKCTRILELWSTVTHVPQSLLREFNLAALFHFEHHVLIDQQTLHCSVKLGRSDVQGCHQVSSVGDLVLFVELSEDVLLELLVSHL